jgi:hypothetical protein
MPARLQLVVPATKRRRLQTEVFRHPVAPVDIGLVFVDDGSTDGTGAIPADLATRDGDSASR